jgi:hypothetical protein
MDGGERENDDADRLSTKMVDDQTIVEITAGELVEAAVHDPADAH